MFNCSIIRHGEKQHGDCYNPSLHHQDQPISENGKRQAEKLIPYFAGKPIAAIYVSTYQRTGQTIAPLARVRGLIPIVDARLNEIDNGDLDDMADTGIAARYPEFWKAYRARDRDVRFPGGEDGAEVRQRILDFLTEKRRQHDDAHILLVSHDGWIRQLVCTILELPVFKRGNFKIDTCGITEIAYEPAQNAWQLIRMNQGQPMGSTGERLNRGWA